MSLQASNGDGGGSGDCPDEKDKTITDLKTQVLNLQAENDTLLSQVNDLTDQVSKLSITPEDPQPEAVSDEALRKRLMRICSRKADGNLKLIQVFFERFTPKAPCVGFGVIQGLTFTEPSTVTFKPPAAQPNFTLSPLRSLKVPEKVHKAWAAGGADRNNLLKLFQESGLDQDRGTTKMMSRLFELSGGAVIICFKTRSVFAIQLEVSMFC